MKITAEIPLVLIAAGEYTREHAQNWADFIKRLARVSEIRFEDAVPQGAVQLVVRGQLAALPLKGVIDLAAERGRLEKEMAKVTADIARIEAKLSNAHFLNRAPEEVVEEEREKREEAEISRAKILEALERLMGPRIRVGPVERAKAICRWMARGLVERAKAICGWVMRQT